MELISLYLHFPFCMQRCAYCDFNTYTGIDHLIPDYVDAMCLEADCVAQNAVETLPVHTIFFGGGTPSLIPLKEIDKILRTISDVFVVQPGAEITMEANPGTVSAEYLAGLKKIGVNRLSIGMQSAIDYELRFLGRKHLFSEVVQSVEWARQAGFSNLNLDLIYGLPDQSVRDWQYSLKSALGLQPEHFSLYALTLEEVTPMARWISRGLVATPDMDLAADMYELAVDRLDRAGFDSYEISNWAKQSVDKDRFACRHNLQYWRGKPYLGLGAGAHGYANHTRTANVLKPETYIERMSRGYDTGRYIFPVSPGNDVYTILSPEEEMGEYMMMGLRLTKEGVLDTNFFDRFGQTLEQVYEPQICRLISFGLLEWIDDSGRRLRLTQNGRLLGNQVFCEFV